MSTQRKDGGAAFPMQFDDIASQNGMSLRDYFAAKAMQGWVAALPAEGLDELDNAPRHVFQEHAFEVAKAAYDYADAMLKARQQ
jgi:hypothetical protein